jgi:Zn-dependent peptidase ImmA (M78 family)/transcriptional regulator with XRE-family HTH domain
VAAKVTGLNGTVLAWARKRSGLSVEEVAHRLKKDPSVIQAWEAGEEGDAPTYVQLEKLSYELYNRPIAIFFFPEPPEEPEAKGEFRLIPEAELEQLSPEALFAVRHARAAQESPRELTGGANPAETRILGEVDARRFGSLEALCGRARERLGVSLVTQLGWDSLDTALKEWRAALENRGVFVFKRAFRDDDISGFCLFDRTFPVIFINNSTSPSRQVFTLLHEFAHLLYHASGVTLGSEGYIQALPPDDRKIEVLCNRFAAAFLVPDADFDHRSAGIGTSDVEVSELARLYNVSRETILRKFLDRELVTQDHYERKRDEWNAAWRKTRADSSGGDYYRTQAAYLSGTYTKLAFNGYYDGRYGVEQLGDYLGMKARNVARFETYLTAL